MPPATISNLTERRMPQFIAIYLGAAWGLVQFVDFIGTRYALSPRWTDLTLLAVGLLLPSVLLYTYHHGRPGPDSWQKSEKIFIPINVLILVGVLFSVGAGTNLSAVATRVKIKDEKGNTVDAVVPNSAYRKRVAMFAFDADGSSKWLSLGAPLLTQIDLEQQQFIQVVSTIELRQALLEAGYPDGSNVPLSLKRDVANERHIPHFVAGSIQQTANGVTAHVKLYETATAKLLKEHTFTAPTVSDVSDMISAQLMQDLAIPVLSDAKPDMPVAELTTQKPEALRGYVDAVNAIVFKNDYQGAKQSLDKAVKLDPTFAYAQVQRYAADAVMGAQAEAVTAIQAALDHSYRLPDRAQQMVKVMYYESKQDYLHAFAVIDMLSKMYPEDIAVLEQQASLGSIRDDKPLQVAALKKILKLDPTRGEMMLQLGGVYEAQGDAANALAQYETYAKRYPNESRSFRTLGALYAKTGEHAKARAAYEQALLVKPQEVVTLLQMASLDCKTGDFTGAQDKIDQAMAASKTPQEKAMTLSTQSALQEFSGQIAKSVATKESSIATSAAFLPPVQLVIARLALAGKVAKIDPARAERDLAATKKELGPMFEMFAPLGQLDVYYEMKDAAREQQAVTDLEATIKKTSFKAFDFYALQGHGRVEELRGNYVEAIRWYGESVKKDPLDVSVQGDIGRCYRKLNKTAEAQKALNSLLKVVPANGDANLEMALLYQQTGDVPHAKQYAATAMKTWQNADASFKPAAEARLVLNAR